MMFRSDPVQAVIRDPPTVRLARRRFTVVFLAMTLENEATPVPDVIAWVRASTSPVRPAMIGVPQVPEALV